MSAYLPSSLLKRLVRELIDQSINQDGMNQLETILKTDHEARCWYLQEFHIHGALHRWATRQKQTITDESENINFKIRQDLRSVDEILKEQRQRNRRISLLAAAAVIALCVIVMKLFFVDTTRPPTLAFETSPGTQFTISHDNQEGTPTGPIMEKGSRLQLTQGTVELTFESGVKSIVMAPADLTLHDDSTLFLNKGTAWFHVPQQAVGFKVKTKDLNIVDLGTEFGVIATPGDHDEVHVLKGKVQVTTLRIRKESVMLTAGNARRIDPIGRLDTIPAKPSTFLKSLPQSLPYLHWSFESRDELLAENSLHNSHPIKSKLQGVTSEMSNAFIPGVIGNALSLDGNSQYIETNWEGILGNESRSIAFWIKIPDGDKIEKRTILGWGTQQKFSGKPNAKQVINLINSSESGRQLLIGFGGNWLSSPFLDIPSDAWQHVAVTYDGELTKEGEPHVILYLNGLKQELTFYSDFSSDSPVNIDTRSETPLLFGAVLPFKPNEPISQNKLLKAQLDEVFIIQGAIDQSTVKQLIKTNRLQP